MVEGWVSELAEQGIRAGTAERLLLRRAAELSQVRPHRNEDHVRTVNTISKLLAQAGFRKDRPRKRKPTMVAALGEGDSDWQAPGSATTSSAGSRQSSAFRRRCRPSTG
jgi:hypothetical protein